MCRQSGLYMGKTRSISTVVYELLLASTGSLIFKLAVALFVALLLLCTYLGAGG